MSFVATLAAALISGAPNFSLQAPALRPTTLAALERIVWNATERGPLLIINPERVVSLGGMRFPNLVFRGTEGVNVLEAGRVMERKLAHTERLSALVPETLQTLAFEAPQALNPQDATLALAASLSPAQWQLLCGTNGLGARDLSAEQQRYFQALLPQELTQGALGQQERSDAEKVPATALAQGQLHLGRKTNFYFVYQEEKLNRGVGGSFSGKTITGEDPRPRLSRDFSARPVRPETPSTQNRLKPSHLDYKSAALNKPVSLEGLTTVGELVQRAAQATRLELIADRRIANQPLWVRLTPGQSVPAGEVLELLALSVTGTFRKLEVPGKGVAFVLTDDIEGLAPRLARQRQWQQEAQKPAQERQKAYTERLKATNPERFIGYDNEFGLDAGLLSRLDESRQTAPGGWGYLTTPLSTLPPSIAKQLTSNIQSSIEDYQKGLSRSTINGVVNPPLDPNRVKLVTMELQFSLDVPGYGLYKDDSIRSSTLSQALRSIRRDLDPTPLPPLPPRPPLKQSIVVLAPTSEAEARQVVEAAAAARLTRLWIVTDGAKLEPLKAAVAAGKKVGLPIVALLVLSQLPETAPADVDLFGQPSPYRIPDSPQTRAVLLPRLRAVATLPDLAGIALAETAALGYVAKKSSSMGGGQLVPNDYGYTPERRLNFLRTEGYDPLDITTGNNVYMGAFSRSLFFRSSPQLSTPQIDPTVRWSEVRFAANKALLSEVYTTLKTANPTLPLWIEGRQQEYGNLLNSWYGSWDKAEPLPSYRTFHEREPGTDPTPLEDDIGQARQYSKEILFANPYPDPLIQQRSPRVKESLEAWWTILLTGELRENNVYPWDGAVLDLRTLPIEEALKVLKATKL